jgi:hypothetical protein
VCASLLSCPRLGVVDEDAPYGLGGAGIELSPSLPRHLARADQLEVGFVHEGGRGERVIRPFRCHPKLRRLSQLPIDEGEEPIRGTLVAAGGGIHERRGVRWRRGLCVHEHQTRCSRHGAARHEKARLSVNPGRDRNCRQTDARG